MGRQRAQTAEILKASYFSSKHISPHLEALELLWNIPCLTFPLPSPSIWNPPAPTVLMSQPAGETKSFSSGQGFAHSLIPRPLRAPRKSAPGTACPTPGSPGLGRAGQMLPSSEHTCQLLSETTLLFGMAKKEKKKFSFWCWLKGNTKHLNKTFQIFLRTELSLCGHWGKD